MKQVKICLLIVASSLFLFATEKQKIFVGAKMVIVEVASTHEEHQKGLMFRKKLPENEGMLFVFKEAGIRRFWMKNTFIPLSIGYFDKNRKLIEVIDMEPATSEMAVNLPHYESSKPAKYALEMNRGWFRRNKIKPGTELKLK